jgi:hypothetical protein
MELAQEWSLQCDVSAKSVMFGQKIAMFVQNNATPDPHQKQSASGSHHTGSTNHPAHCRIRSTLNYLPRPEGYPINTNAQNRQHNHTIHPTSLPAGF